MTTRYAEILLRSGAVTDELLRVGLREQERTHGRLGPILVKNQALNEELAKDALAQASGFDKLQLAPAMVDPMAFRDITPDWAFDQGVAPLWIERETRQLVVAIADPTNPVPLDELSFRTGLKIKALVATETEVSNIVRHVCFGEKLTARPRSNPPPLPEPDGGPEITRGIHEERDALHDLEARRPSRPPSNPAPRPSSVPRGGDPRPSVPVDPLMVALQRLAITQEAAAMELQVLFELCTERGLFSKQEYLFKLNQKADY